MTAQELAFKKFDKLFSYEWYAQEDGGNKTVIFSYVEKAMFRKPKEEWKGNKRFEAESLEKAFNYAFSNEGLIEVEHGNYRSMFGKITAFDHEKWNEQVFADKFWSVGDKCWKSLKQVVEAEKRKKYETALS